MLYIVNHKQRNKKIFELNSCILKEVDHNPYLGIILSKDLKCETHIDQVCKKANSAHGFIQRNLKKCPTECKKTAYVALVRSTLEYAAVVWDPHLDKDITKIEKISARKPIPRSHFIDLR